MATLDLVLESGVYLIRNKYSNNHLVISNGRQGEPIISRSLKSGELESIADSFKWKLTLLSNKRYIIENVGTGHYVRYSWTSSLEGSRDQDRSNFQWSIVCAHEHDSFMIIGRFGGREVLWSLDAAEDGYPVHLQKQAQHPKTFWSVEPFRLADPRSAPPSRDEHDAEHLRRVLSERDETIQTLHHERSALKARIQELLTELQNLQCSSSETEHTLREQVVTVSKELENTKSRSFGSERTHKDLSNAQVAKEPSVSRRRSVELNCEKPALTSKLDDLEDEITAHRRAVDLTPGDDPAKPWRLSILGNSCRTRFERLGELADIEEAITAHRHAVELTPEGDPAKPWRLSNLGNSCRTRSERLRELAKESCKEDASLETGEKSGTIPLAVTV